MKIRFGILGCASIARRMMIPALALSDEAELVALAARDPLRAQSFALEFGCAAEESYTSLLARPDIDAIYLPLPPALHEHWATQALAAGKHVLCEKPLTSDLESAKRLVEAARRQKRVLAENWMFIHHRQIHKIDELLCSGQLGHLRLMRATFGFPPLDDNNFRYRSDLGGGALLDAGGYTLRAALHFLGEDLKVMGSALITPPGSTVDRFGSGLVTSPHGVTAQVAFGFDVFYQCQLELWLTRGKITAPRIFTAPPDFSPDLRIDTAGGTNTISILPDNHFANAIRDFTARIRENRPDYDGLLEQAKLTEEFRQKCTSHRYM